MELHDRYGPVSVLGYGRLRYVYLFGREANEYLLATAPENFRWREAFAPLIPVDGETALVVSDGDEHRRRRRLVQPAFGLRRIEGHVPVIVEEAERVFERWHPGASVDLYDDFRLVTRRVVLRALFGDVLAGRADELGEHLQIAIDYVNRPPWARWDVDLPGSPYRKALQARRRADGIVFAEIQRRRSSGDLGPDVLGALLGAQDVGGAGLTDQEVRDQVVSLVAAGYDTTSAAVGWAMAAVLHDRDVHQRLQEEVDRVLGEDPLTVDHLGTMPYLDGVVNETLRLHSPAVLAPRKAVAAFELHGHVVPAGSMVVYSPYVTHRMAELWPEPKRFAPQRWAGDEPSPYSYVPFGGGYRRCIGFALAIEEVKVFLAEAVRRFELAPVDRMPSPTGIATMSPDGGVPATIVGARRRVRSGPGAECR